MLSLSRLRRKYGDVQIDAARREFFVEGGDGTGGAVVAGYFSVLGYAGLHEFEDVLHRDLVAFQAHDFRDADDFAGAVGEAGFVDYDVHCGGDLFADGAGGEFHAGHQHHRLQT